MIELLPLSLVILYFVPFTVAAARDHDSFVTILVVNAVVGWTGVGWIAVLLWACLSPPRNGAARAPAQLRRVT